VAQNQTILVRHNMEMAHRLFLTEGKCEAIHGHSWDVTLKIRGRVDMHGLLEGLDFGQVKRLFRGHLDKNFDHRLLLNSRDPWSDLLTRRSSEQGQLVQEALPGLHSFDGDPTTENVARVIGEWAVDQYGLPIAVEVFETRVNMAAWPAEGFVSPVGF
jgi:6-pyruvoyl-tetrahydropterin synthase